MNDTNLEASNKYTIVICTHNRHHFARACMNALLSILNGRTCAILLIDNASKDKTYEMQYILEKQLVYIREDNVGLSNARNAALNHCETEYIVYLDDDALPDETWFCGIEEAIAAGADVFGGPYRPFYTSERPQWFDDELGSAHLDLENGPQRSGVCFSGGNMGWRTGLLKDFGGFDARLGMIGDRVRLAEETALQLAMQKRDDLKFYFSKKMSMLHHVSAKKMTLIYILLRNLEYGKTLVHISPDNHLVRMSFLRFVKQTKFGAPLLYRLIARDRLKYPYWKTYAARYITLNSICVGCILGRHRSY